MKTIISFALLFVLILTDNSEYNKLIADFTHAVQTGDKSYLKEHIDPVATWSAPFQKLLRSREEIVSKLNGIEEGHQIITTDIEYFRDENTLHVFGIFNYLQNQEISHSGRFTGIFEVNRESIYQMKHGLWQLDGTHIKEQQ